MKKPTNRRTKKAKTGVRDLPVKQSVSGRVKGGEVTGQHYKEVTLEMWGTGPRTLGEAAVAGAVAAGTGAAAPK